MYLFDRTLILHNPRCGAPSLAAYLGASLVPGAPAHATMSEARKRMGADEWKTLTVIVPVRDPFLRFRSAVLAAAEAAGDFRSEDALALDTLAFLADSGPKPVERRDLWPQTSWLTGHADFVVPTFELHRLTAVFPRPYSMRPSNPGKPIAISMSKGVRRQVETFYEKDFARFANLPVWPSGDGQIYLLSGRCPSCEKRRPDPNLET